jgi:hypothetical protein
VTQGQCGSDLRRVLPSAVRLVGSVVGYTSPRLAPKLRVWACQAGAAGGQQRSPSASQPGSRPGSAASSSSSTGSGAAPAASQQQAWSVLQLFGWRQAAAAAQKVNEPVATRLQIAGVSLSLATWRLLPPGDDDADPSAARQQHASSTSAVSPTEVGAASSAARATGPVAEQHAGGSSSGQLPAWQRQQRDHTGEASRRKQRLAAAGLDPADANQPRRRQPSSSLQGAPAAEYLLLQQWGAEVALTVLPPGQRPNPSAEAARAEPGPAAGGSAGRKSPMSTADGVNSSVPSSPASFRSWSIPAGNGAANGHPPHRPDGPDAAPARSQPSGAKQTLQMMSPALQFYRSLSSQHCKPGTLAPTEPAAACQASGRSCSFLLLAAGGAAQRASESGTAALPAGSPTLHVVASLRACVVTAGAPELAVGLRLLQTAQDYARSERHWRSRPQVRRPSGNDSSALSSL